MANWRFSVVGSVVSVLDSMRYNITPRGGMLAGREVVGCGSLLAERGYAVRCVPFCVGYPALCAFSLVFLQDLVRFG